MNKTELREKFREHVTKADNSESKCQAGCKVFTGGEIKHHKDCVYYPESMSKRLDDFEADNSGEGEKRIIGLTIEEQLQKANNRIKEESEAREHLRLQLAKVIEERDRLNTLTAPDELREVLKGFCEHWQTNQGVRIHSDNIDSCISKYLKHRDE